MPVLRYFFFVGGALLALLFISDYYLPNSAVADKTADAADAGIDKSIIRIQSDRKWPERVVFDTGHPAVVPAQTAAAVAPAAVADVSARATRVGNAFAQLQPPDQQQAQSSDPKKPEQKASHKRKIAKRRNVPPVMLVAQQPQFGLFGNNTW